MTVEIYPSEKRQHVKHGEKFDSWQSFSFGNWYDAKRSGFGALRVFNDDTIGVGSEIGMHPHQNYEILSVMLDGKMSHKDSLHNYQVIETEAIQLISCGTGIYHAGENLAENRYTHFLQIWVEPNVLNTEPDLQLKQFDIVNSLEKWDLRVSPQTMASTIQIKQNCFCSRGVFSTNASYTLNTARNGVWLFVIDGSIEIQGVIAQKGDTLMINNVSELAINILSKADLWLMELPMTEN
jgi:quercetin 2,3-dioxygenase